MATRTRLATEVRREQLLAVALDQFGDRGYGEVSIDDVAAAAGVSHGLLFHYFGDKRRLYLATLAWVGERLVEETAPRAGEEAGDRLRASLRAHLDFADRYSAGWTALFHGGNGSDAEVQRLCEEARWRALRHVTQALGVERPDPVLRVALRGWQGFIEGAILEWLKRREPDPEAVVELMARALDASLRLARVGSAV